ncbi:MAG: DUF2269 domain-containing protein, partial [Comamonadaceae bacterium]
EYLVVKWLHVISSTVLRADWLFTATTAVLQPLTGFWMVHLAGYPMATPWLKVSIVCYALALACWFPVVWLQMRLRDLAGTAAQERTALPARYWQLFRWWVALGIPAFILFVAIFWLMVSKPAW